MSQYTTTTGLTFSTEMDGDEWIAVEERTGMFGEGDTDEAAAKDLLASLLSLRDDLRSRPLGTLSPEIAATRAYLERMLPR